MASPLRLRIPESLAIALLGASATVAVSFGGCQEDAPQPVDAGRIDRPHIDASIADSGGSDASTDAPPDAAVDAGVPDARPDAPETPMG